MAYLGQGTNGQVPIAETSGDVKFATITSTGGTITFTLGANTLNMEVAGSGESWTEVTTATQAMLPNKGYILNGGTLITATLPSAIVGAAAGIGATIVLMGKGAGGWLIAQNASQQINFGRSQTLAGAGGSLASTHQWDSVTLVLVDTAGLVWAVHSPVGNLTVV